MLKCDAELAESSRLARGLMLQIVPRRNQLHVRDRRLVVFLDLTRLSSAREGLLRLIVAIQRLHRIGMRYQLSKSPPSTLTPLFRQRNQQFVHGIARVEFASTLEGSHDCEPSRTPHNGER
jgi:hypothetical protein